jgi:AraC family transcriptional activator of mtrCDE
MEINEGNTTPSEPRCAVTPARTSAHDGVLVPPWLSFEALNRLVSTMDVQVIALSECVVGPGFELDLAARDTPSFHYIREGYGRLYTRDQAPAEIGPHALIIVPPHCPFRFAPIPPPPFERESVEESHAPNRKETTAFMLCGAFRSLYANSIDLFDELHVPIVEQFSKEDGLEHKLQLALTELMSGKVCCDVLVSTAMKQVIVALIRRSVLAGRSWTRRFAVLSATEHESTRLRERDDIR